MKPYRWLNRLRAAARNRRGTVIVIVLAMLGMLAFLGVFIFNFTASENQSATYFAAAAKVDTVDPSDPYFNFVLRQLIIGPSSAERQSALWGGTKSLLPTMFGRDMQPFNGQGINLVLNSPMTAPFVDQNYDGASTDPNDNQNLLQLNLSPAAQGSLLDLNNFPNSNPMPTSTIFPDPDTGVTSVDINNPFLAYDGIVPNSTGNPVRVIIPSFHRPAQLRNVVTQPNWSFDPSTQKLVLFPHSEHLAIDSSGNVTATQRFVSTVGLTPHPDTSGGTTLHSFPFPGSPGLDGQPGVAGVDDDGDGTVDDASELGWKGSDDGPPPSNNEGVWSSNSATPDKINYGVDVDNDGVNDAFYMDFGFPMMADASGAQYIPMVAIKVLDADALLNFNVHGNRSGHADLPVPSNFGGVGGNSAFISRSNQGLSASEVNPEWALNTRPLNTLDYPGSTLAADLQSYVLLFRDPPDSGTLPIDDHSNNSFELANMEWWNLLNGRPQLSPGANPLSNPPTVSGSSLSGRYGENTNRLDIAVQQIVAGTTVSGGADVSGDLFPLPGVSGSDDNNNAAEGGLYADSYSINHLAFVSPVDYFGAGSTLLPNTYGKQKLLIVEGEEKFPGYQNYWVNATTLWATYFGGGVNGNGNFTSLLMTDTSGTPSSGARQVIDEPDETTTESTAVTANDAIFDPSENNIQLSNGDFSAIGKPGRTAALMPFNFNTSARAQQIRQRFTSTSWDIKSFGKEFLGIYGGSTNDARRLWEFTDLATSGAGTGPFRFPPTFGTGGTVTFPVSPYTAATNYPLRVPVANLLQVLANPQQQSNTNTGTILPQRPLSANGLTEQWTTTDSEGNTIYPFRFRPLTPHPSATTTLANTAITAFPTAAQSKTLPPVAFVAEPEQLTAGNAQQQEWLARYDRQRMARDIYTLLYLMGGGSDVLNYASNGTGASSTNNEPSSGIRPLYTDDQLQEMAQFAVNWVDALDPDSNITIFEYDKNLADGWNLDDNAYDAIADSNAPYSLPNAGDRGVVYGVERQQLALNEAMVVYSQKCYNTVSVTVPANHPDTQWDDTNQWAFFYLELENVSPASVSFANSQWQVAVKQSPILTTPSTYYANAQSGEMRLIVNSAQPDVAAGSLNSKMTIGGMVGSSNGTTYSITNNDSSGNPYPSYLVVDPNDTTGTVGNTGVDYQIPIAPRKAFGGYTTTPFANTTALDLDLSSPTQSSRYSVVPPNATTPTADGAAVTLPVPGMQLLQFTDGTAQSITPQANLIVLRVELRRRADLNRAAILPSDPNNIAESTDNPWIVVDHMDVPVSVMALKINGTANDYSPQIQYQLGSLTPPTGSYNFYSGPGSAVPVISTERSQPLYHDYQLNPFNPTTTNPTQPNGPFLATAGSLYSRNGGASTRAVGSTLWQGNSLGQDNDAADNDNNPSTPIPAHPLYQPHFDRDFGSVGELLNIPLYGPYASTYPAPTTLNNPLSSGGGISLTSGLTHLMASRVNEVGGATLSAAPTTELLVGADYVPTDVGLNKQHYVGYGTAGFRIQHPEGGDPAQPSPATDFTENRWHRLLGLVEVPTRSHRGLETGSGYAWDQINAGSIGGALGFYRTPGKINLNTVRHPDVLAGLLDDKDTYNLGFASTAAMANYPTNLSVPSSLPTWDTTDTVQAPTAGAARDWWAQFLLARDGIDPITGLSLPGVPRSAPGQATTPPGFLNNTPTGARPFRNLGFSAFGGVDANGYNGPLESTILRTLPGDTLTSVPTATNPDPRRRLFEVGTLLQHQGTSAGQIPAEINYDVRHRLLSKMLGNTTTRSNVFLVWIQVDFFEAKDVNPPNGVVRVGAKLATSPGYRGFFVVDRSKALDLVQQQHLPDPSASPFIFSFNQSFNYQSLILHRQRIQ